MKEISCNEITEKIRGAFLACACASKSASALQRALSEEASPLGREVLSELLENYDIAGREMVPVCQDTGMATVFAEVGQEVHITGGAFESAVQEGVRRAYTEGYLRKSVVKDPLYERVNTGDNTPAVIHTRLISGDSIRFLCIAKGFGSENMSRLFMLAPAEGEKGVLEAIVKAVSEAGPNPCPPVTVGVSIGGSAESAMEAAKRMTACAPEYINPDPRYAALEQKALAAVNRLGIGPGGTGGVTTALAVHIFPMPTHIAGMPVAVNICCHALRYASAVI